MRSELEFFLKFCRITYYYGNYIQQSEAKTDLVIRNYISYERFQIHCFSDDDDFVFHILVFEQISTIPFNQKFEYKVLM